jgi:hypothetical protein
MQRIIPIVPQSLNLQNDRQVQAMDEGRRFQQFVAAHQKIVTEALKHTNKTGYLSFRLDENFLLIESSFHFVQGEFCREEFAGNDNSNFKVPPGTEIIDAFYLYFSILGADNVSTWKIRKLMLIEKQG